MLPLAVVLVACAAPASAPVVSESSTIAGLGTCDDTTVDAIQGTITQQQAAFGKRDYAGARALASERFRSTVAPEQFEVVIEGAYGFLIDDPSITFGPCTQEGDSALMTVEVAGDPAVLMEYRMVNERGGWFIDAAGVAGTREQLTA